MDTHHKTCTENSDQTTTWMIRLAVTAVIFVLHAVLIACFLYHQPSILNTTSPSIHSDAASTSYANLGNTDDDEVDSKTLRIRWLEAKKTQLPIPTITPPKTPKKTDANNTHVPLRNIIDEQSIELDPAINTISNTTMPSSSEIKNSEIKDSEIKDSEIKDSEVTNSGIIPNLKGNISRKTSETEAETTVMTPDVIESPLPTSTESSQPQNNQSAQSTSDLSNEINHLGTDPLVKSNENQITPNYPHQHVENLSTASLNTKDVDNTNNQVILNNEKYHDLNPITDDNVSVTPTKSDSSKQDDSETNNTTQSDTGINEPKSTDTTSDDFVPFAHVLAEQNLWVASPSPHAIESSDQSVTVNPKNNVSNTNDTKHYSENDEVHNQYAHQDSQNNSITMTLNTSTQITYSQVPIEIALSHLIKPNTPQNTSNDKPDINARTQSMPTEEQTKILSNNKTGRDIAELSHRTLVLPLPNKMQSLNNEGVVVNRENSLSSQSNKQPDTDTLNSDSVTANNLNFDKLNSNHLTSGSDNIKADEDIMPNGIDDNDLALVVEFYVNEHGKVKQSPPPIVLQSSGYQALDTYGLLYLQDLQFTPFIQQDKIVEVVIHLPIRYQAQ